MDISFYILLVLACLVLLLAMWACAASGTTKWGPDLTLELPPHLLQEALFGPNKRITTKEAKKGPMPSAPTELVTAPLLCNEQPVGLSNPVLSSFNPCVTIHTDTAVRVLPPRYEPVHKVKSPPPVPPRYHRIHQVKPVIYKFSTEEPA